MLLVHPLRPRVCYSKGTMPPLEVPVFSAESAQAAVALGAARIELNHAGSYPAGGLTPTVADLEALQHLEVPVRVMIRPRGPPDSSSPDFTYDAAELDDMRGAILAFRNSGLLRQARGDGFVFGVLRAVPAADGEHAAVAVDIEENAVLVRAAYPFACVFHRAYDDVVASPAGDGGAAAWARGLDDIITLGFDGILTSGGPGRAPDNVSMLRQIVDRARGDIEIIVGGGVRSESLSSLADLAGPPHRNVSFHSSCMTSGLEEEKIDGQEVTGILDQLRSLDLR